MKKLIIKCTIVVLFSIVLGGMLSIAQSSVEINQYGDGSAADNLTVVNGRLYFSANNGIYGEELYYIENHNAQVSISSFAITNFEIDELTNLSDRLVFSGGVDMNRRMYQVLNNNPNNVEEILGAYSSGYTTPSDFIEHNGFIYFIADGIWRVNMTGNTAEQVSTAVTSNGVPRLSDDYQKNIFVVANKIFLPGHGVTYLDLNQSLPITSASVANTGSYEFSRVFDDFLGYFAGNNILYRITGPIGTDNELLLIDAGASSPTATFIDLLPGGSSQPNHFIEHDGYLFFTAVSPNFGRVLWYFDGSGFYDSMAGNFQTGSWGFPDNDPLIKVDGRLYYSNHEVVTTGTVPEISLDEQCFGYPYFEHTVLKNDDKFNYIDVNNAFNIYECDENGLVNQLTCFENLDNAIENLTWYNGKIYFTSPRPSDYQIELYRFPQDPGRGLCEDSDACPNGVITFDKNSDQIIASSPLSGNPDFTVEFLTKLNLSNPGGQSIRKFFKWINPDNSEPFGIYNVNNSLRIVDRYFDGGQNYIIPFTTNIRDGNWHHVAITKQGDLMTVYLDNDVYSYTTNVVSTFDLPDKIKLGRSSELASVSLDGQMDEFRIWDHARSQTELQNSLNSALNGNEYGLVLYYSFDQGFPNEDNSCLPIAIDKSGNGFDGRLVSFTLDGTLSNITTSDLNITVIDNYCNEDPCPIDFTCSEECKNANVDLSTGINFNDGSLLPVGQYDGGWQMISGPDANITYPRPGFVIDPHPSWETFPGATYISPFADDRFNGEDDIPYLFERCFCVCEDNQEITIDLKAYVDNFLKIGLYDEQGNLIEELIDHDSFLGAPAESHTTRTLEKGTYCLRAGLRNDGAVSMGMSIEAKISGAGLIENGCCAPFTIISGSVLVSSGCNPNSSINEPLEGVSVTLTDSQGNEIASTTSDAQGFYIFHDVQPGTYIVRQEEVSGYHLLAGALGLEVTIGENEVVGEINFGNCPDATSMCCATDEELSMRAHEIITPNILYIPEYPDECLFGIESVEGLYSCQFVGLIMWGDGVLTEIGAGDPIPTHEYTEAGVYVISVFVYSQNENGEICQTDIIDITLAYAKECAVANINTDNEKRFILQPNPARDELVVDLTHNASGYSGEIRNELGELVSVFQIEAGNQSFVLPVFNLVSGVFTLSLVDGDGHRLASRFVKM